MKDYILLLPILFIFHDMEEIIGFGYFFRNNKQLFERFPKITAAYKDFSTEGFALAVTSISNNRIVFKVKHQLWPEFFASQGYEYKDEAFVIVLEDGRWKCDEISPHT